MSEIFQPHPPCLMYRIAANEVKHATYIFFLGSLILNCPLCGRVPFVGAVNYLGDALSISSPLFLFRFPVMTCCIFILFMPNMLFCYDRRTDTRSTQQTNGKGEKEAAMRESMTFMQFMSLTLLINTGSKGVKRYLVLSDILCDLYPKSTRCGYAAAVSRFNYVGQFTESIPK